MTATVARGQRGWQETVAIVLLLVGGFLWGVGWLVGVILLWLSDVWSLRDKLLGTFVLPFGLALPLFLVVFRGLAVDRSGWVTILWLVTMLLAVLATIATAVHLAHTSRRVAA